ncbi:MAG: hypothetical protein M0Q53_12325 [Prolixibacteraceae bacterium]|jgi:hypothetical protein|nr:hypothetical protein [Prolixibacteraceae bacterium]
MEILLEKPENGTTIEPIEETEYEFEVAKQIIVHCRCDSRGHENDKVRIWKTTYLVDKESGCKSNLLFAFNISFYPIWDIFPLNGTKRFTLVFGLLPKSCKKFDLLEVTDDRGAFVSNGITRNKEDVYHLKL